MSLPSHQLIPVEDRRQKLESDDLSEALWTGTDEWADTECAVCKSTDSAHDHLAMICDGCDAVYHTFCVGLEAVPDDPLWFCPKCTVSMEERAETTESVDSGDTTNSLEIPEDENENDDEEWTPNSDNVQNHRNRGRKQSRKRRRSRCTETSPTTSRRKKRKIVNAEDIIDCDSWYRPGVNLECDDCDELFDHHTEYRKHMETEHDVVKPYRCYQCSKSYGERKSLVHHIKREHNQQVNYECNECGHGFYLKTHWTEHMLIHSGERPHQCERCGDHFRYKNEMKRHIKEVHDQVRPYKCTNCKETFKRKERLMEHASGCKAV